MATECREMDEKMSYEVIYMLKPKYEDLKRGGAGWWKLQWRPIWKQTFSAYYERRSSSWFSFQLMNWDARNGWHRSYKHRLVFLTIFTFKFAAWVRWDFMVHKDGPSDASEKRPLNINGGINGR